MPVPYATDAQINALITGQAPFNTPNQFFNNPGDSYIRTALENAVLAREPNFGHPGDPGVGVISPDGSFNPPWAQVMELTGSSTPATTYFAANPGEVVIINNPSATTYIADNNGVIGTVAGSEVTWVSGSGDQVYVGSGPQQLASFGDNTVYGGDGADTLYASAGDLFATNQNVGNTLQSLSDTAHHTQLTGGSGSGADVLIAGAGADTLDAGTGSGNDSLWGGSGNGQLLTAANSTGADTLTAGTGIGQHLVGGSGSDVLQDLNGGHDTLQAGSGNSYLAGTNGDTLLGGSGNDTFFAVSGSVSMTGGAGNDVFVVQSNAGTESDTIDGGGGSNALVFQAAGQSSHDLAVTPPSTSGGVTTIQFNSGATYTVTNVQNIYFTDGYDYKPT